MLSLIRIYQSKLRSLRRPSRFTIQSHLERKEVYPEETMMMMSQVRKSQVVMMNSRVSRRRREAIKKAREAAEEAVVVEVVSPVTEKKAVTSTDMNTTIATSHSIKTRNQEKTVKIKKERRKQLVLLSKTLFSLLKQKPKHSRDGEASHSEEEQ